ncbi:MAG: ORF6N domain-containing protein [Elusimicrobiota bacterium]
MKQQIIHQEMIEKKIFLIRGQKVMLDKDLSELYDVETRVLNQSVKRNIDRFPEDFMFQLKREEIMRISQIVISLKFSKSVYAFTEQGVAMLSSVLNSKRAIHVNIGIMRVFVNIRKIASSNKEIITRLNQLEKRVEMHDNTSKTIFEVIRTPMLSSETTLISPEKPFTNRKIFWDIIKY